MNSSRLLIAGIKTTIDRSCESIYAVVLVDQRPSALGSVGSGDLTLLSVECNQDFEIENQPKSNGDGWESRSMQEDRPKYLEVCSCLHVFLSLFSNLFIRFPYHTCSLVLQEAFPTPCFAHSSALYFPFAPLESASTCLRFQDDAVVYKTCTNSIWQ